MELSNKSNRVEIFAGITTFFTMSYIVIVNPLILSTEGTGIPFGGALTATVILSFLMTLLMGVYAKLPFAVAPGMGINAFFTFNLIISRKIPWPVAMGMVFWSGVFFLLLSATPLREKIARAIPMHLRLASAAGIGLLLAFIGFKNLGMIEADPATFVRIGSLGQTFFCGAVGFAVTVALFRNKSPFAFIAGIIVSSILAAAGGHVVRPEHFLAWPDFSTFWKFDPWGALQIAFLPAIFSMMMTDLFDSLSTFVGVSQAAGLLDAEGNPKNLKQGLIVDSLATMLAGPLGTSSGTAYIESAAGIEVGGRTGLTAVVTALCFLPCLFLAPLAGMVPIYATAPVLIIVGALMFKTVGEMKLSKFEDVFPAFLTVSLIPLTFSITQGILWGFISHVCLYALAGRRRELSLTLLVVAAFSVLLLLVSGYFL